MTSAVNHPPPLNGNDPGNRNSADRIPVGELRDVVCERRENRIVGNVRSRGPEKRQPPPKADTDRHYGQVVSLKSNRILVEVRWPTTKQLRRRNG